MLFTVCRVLHGYNVFDSDTSETRKVTEAELKALARDKRVINTTINEQGQLEFLAGCSYAMRDIVASTSTAFKKNFVVAEVYSESRKKVVGYCLVVFNAQNDRCRWEMVQTTIQKAVVIHKKREFANAKCYDDRLVPKYGRFYRLSLEEKGIIQTKSKNVLESRSAEEAIRYIDQYNDCSNQAMTNYVKHKMKNNRFSSKATAAAVACILLAGLSIGSGSLSRSLENKPLQTVEITQSSENMVGYNINKNAPSDALSAAIRIKKAKAVEVKDETVYVDGVAVASLSKEKSNGMMHCKFEGPDGEQISGMDFGRITQSSKIMRNNIGGEVEIERDENILTANVGYKLTGNHSTFTAKNGKLKDASGNLLYSLNKDKDGTIRVVKESSAQQLDMLLASSILVQLDKDTEWAKEEMLKDE